MMRALLVMISCGLLMLLGGCDSESDSGMSFDDLAQLEQSEQGELLAMAEQAAGNWNFSSAEGYLSQAEEKGYDPEAVDKTKGVISQQRNAYRENERRKEEQRRQEEQRRLAAQQRQNSGRSAVSSSDMKNWCLGASSESSYCYSIQDSDMKSACLGMTQDSSNCYSIRDGDMKNLCLGRTKDSSYCYSISNGDLKNTCLGITKDSSYCYSVNNGQYKQLCAGISMDSSNCYSIR